MNSTTNTQASFYGDADTRYDGKKREVDSDEHYDVKEPHDIHALHYGDNEHNDTKSRYDGKGYEDTDISHDDVKVPEILTQDDTNTLRHEANAEDDSKPRFEEKVEEYIDTSSPNIREAREDLTRDDTEARYDANAENNTKLRLDGKEEEYTNSRFDVKEDYALFNRDNLTHNNTDVRYDTEDYRNSDTRYDTTSNYTALRHHASVQDDHTSHSDKEHHTDNNNKEHELTSKNNETEKNENQPVEDPETLSPGTRLRQAREQNSLSVKHIADKLFLDIGVIESLEADKYEHLPPTIFVRGYLRNDAKLLDISSKSIMISFDKVSQRPPPILAPHSKQQKQASSRDLWPTIGTGAVIVTLMIMMALWQFNQPPTTEPIISQTSINEFDNNIDPWEPEPLVDTTVVSKPIKTGNNNVEKPTKTVTDETTQPTSTAQPTSKNEGETTSATPEKKPHTLRVHFKQRSWMRITDGNGTQLYDGIKSRGKILSLEGTPPFYLKIGNIDGVDVEYQGEIKDVKTYPKQRGYKQTFIVENKE
jgi:cytoskeleton protein RodZ